MKKVLIGDFNSTVLSSSLRRTVKISKKSYLTEDEAIADLIFTDSIASAEESLRNSSGIIVILGYPYEEKQAALNLKASFPERIIVIGEDWDLSEYI
jgi:hypothetical protein